MNNFIYKNKSWLLKAKFFLNSNLKFDIVKYPTPDLYRRIKLLKNNNISIVLDVGANIGQYGSELRSIGYKGKIISFEPTKEAYEKLSKVAKKDSNWEVHNISLGEFDGWTEINISKNSVSSSILNNLPQLTESAPNAVFINKEKIQVKKLDSIFDSLDIKSQNIYFKIDTQGYENMVLEGAKCSLSFITAIQIEMSLVPTYEGVLSFEQMSEKLKNLKFEIFSIESGYYDKQSGRLLEVDGVFIKK